MPPRRTTSSPSAPKPGGEFDLSNSLAAGPVPQPMRASIRASLEPARPGSDIEAHRNVRGCVQQARPDYRAGLEAYPAGEQRSHEDDWEDPPHLGHHAEDEQVRGQEDDGLREVRPDRRQTSPEATCNQASE